MLRGERTAGAPALSRLHWFGGRPFAAKWWGSTMSRVIALVACGFSLAACTASLPSMDFFRSAPPVETLRIESEPPGADARTSQGQTCRTPCELAVQVAELVVTVSLNGYETQTIPVLQNGGTSGQVGTSSGGRLAPNPIFAELQAIAPPPTTKKRPVRKKKRPKTVAKRAPPPETEPAPAAAPPPMAAQPAPPTATQYPWPTR
jgi:PEGA domain